MVLVLLFTAAEAAEVSERQKANVLKVRIKPLLN
jgi:hypothetical protein